MLERDLGKWFLSLIHRRLRSGKVQVDVVLLAGRFAEVFATTPRRERARRLCPPLRRSVGLCPRVLRRIQASPTPVPRCLAGPRGAGSHVLIERRAEISAGTLQSPGGPTVEYSGWMRSTEFTWNILARPA